MGKAIARLLFSLGLTVGAVYLLHTSHDDFAPLPFGKILSPAHGFWQNAERAYRPAQQQLDLPGLQQAVQVVYDSTLAPHIYAENEADLYFVQGYVTASLRLWQMEFQTHVAAGRVSEVVGPRAIEYDRWRRRKGLAWAAERALESMLANDTARLQVEAYTAGVNAYIQQLDYPQLPLEYKILNYTPEPWTPLKCALLLKLMAWDLAGRSYDLPLTRVLAAHGPQAVETAFPIAPPIQDPIIPRDAPQDFTPLQPPPKPATPWDTLAVQAWREQQRTRPLQSPGLSQEQHQLEQVADLLGTAFQLPPLQPHAHNGSNNWAVAGSRTANGSPLLANDPHLGLKLPAIWMEVQLSAPNLNVYGVSLPGAPGVIIGHNQHVAWGVTNVNADVLDWYRIRYKDSLRTHYRVADQWLPVQQRVETLQVKGAPPVLDTVHYTRFGPVVYELGDSAFKSFIPQGYAMRWLGHDPSEEVLTFYLLNRARNRQDYEAALRHYACPAQNFVFADSQEVALWVNGRFPLKWRGQGRFLLDGSRADHQWQGWVPDTHKPHVVNPARGFVSSANQPSTWNVEPYYLNWDYADYERGRRINQYLAQDSLHTVRSMQALQNDNLNLLAQRILPTLLPLLDTVAMKPRAYVLYAKLMNWDHRMQAQSIAATAYHLWWHYLHELIWQDDFPPGDFQALSMNKPVHSVTAKLLLTDTTSRWLDNSQTPNHQERRFELVNTAFRAMVDSLAAYSTDTLDWQWGRYKSMDIQHMLQLPPFSRNNLRANGSGHTVNATRADAHGPSWRMVVQLGPELKSYGVYPGGQSGNPGSPYYDTGIQPWLRGELRPLTFWPNQPPPAEAAVGQTFRLLLQPEASPQPSPQQ